MPDDGRIVDHRHHRVAVAAEHEAGDVLDRDLELVGEEVAEARRCRARPPCRRPCGAAGPENSRSAQTIASSGLVMQMTKASGALRLDALADRLHHLQVDAEQVVAAHAGLARDAGGDDDDVRAGDVGIIVGAGDRRVEAFDRAALRRSSALPCGTPSTTSNRTMSPRPLSAARCASVPPMLPAPISAIFLRAIQSFSVMLRTIGTPRRRIGARGQPLKPCITTYCDNGSQYAISQAAVPLGEILFGPHLLQPADRALELEPAVARRIELRRAGRRRRRAA